MDQLVIYIAEYAIIIPVIILAVVAAWRLYAQRDWKFVTTLILGGLLSLALAKLSSVFYSHTQPFAVHGFEPLIEHDVDNSFPSDHTLLAAFLGLAVYKIRPVVSLGLITLATAIGTARIVAGLHYWVDIIASLGFAAVGYIAAVWTVNKYCANVATSSE